MRGWFFVAMMGALLGCPKPPPKPPAECLPGVPWCEATQTCSTAEAPCKHNPTQDPNHCELAPACPPTPAPSPTPGGCVPDLKPGLLPPPDDSEHWVNQNEASKMGPEVRAALAAAQLDCPDAWLSDGKCLRAGPAGIDLAYAQVSGELHKRRVAAGQAVDADGKRADQIVVGVPETRKWEGWKLFEYHHGCLIGNPYTGTMLYTGESEPNPVPLPSPRPL